MDRNLEYVFSPLNSVDLKSLQKIADSLKNSHKKQEKAVGVFLARVIKYRSGDMPAGSSGNDGEKHSSIKSKTGLRDLY